MIEKLKKHPKAKSFLQFLLIVAVLGLGTAGFIYLKSLKKPPAKQSHENPGPLVEVQIVEAQDTRMLVTGFGTVQAKVNVKLIPEVSGRVNQIHPHLVGGGFFKKDEPLLVIDPRDYQLAVDQARAEVARAEVKLEQEQAEATVARQEWQTLQPGQEPASPLVLREPQIREVQAQLAAAQAQLEKAQLNLQRTVVTLPYDGRVVSKSIDLGQYVQSGQTIAEIYGTEIVEIPIPLEDRDLAWFDIPTGYGISQNNNHANRTEVDIIYDYAGKKHHRSGTVTRSDARVDPLSRMVYVIVEVAKPFADGSQAPLVPGTFVQADIKGHLLKNTILVPSHAIRNGREVWIVHDGKLHIKPVTIARSTPQQTYISSGLNPGNAIVLTSLETVTEGMKVRTQLAVSNQQSELSEKGERP